MRAYAWSEFCALSLFPASCASVNQRLSNEPLVANAGGPYSGQVGQTVSFDASKSTAPAGGPLTYSWDFGDKTTGIGRRPTHSYTTAAFYAVRLTVTDRRGGVATVSTSAAIQAAPGTPPASPSPNRITRDASSQLVVKDELVVMLSPQTANPDTRITEIASRSQG